MTTKQHLRLKLKGHTLFSHRLGKNGRSSERPFAWEIRELSLTPRAMFQLIQGFVRKRVSQCYEKNFESVRRAVLRGLGEAAVACGCELATDGKGGDVCWLLDGKSFFAFQVHQGATDELRAKKMRGRSPILRWVIEIDENGAAKFKPQKAKH
jgi:hypothetical protein